MENQNNLQLNDQAIDALRESAKWSMFLAIIGFIGIGFMLIAAIFMGSVMSMIPNQAPSTNPFGMMKGFISVIYIVLAGLYFAPIYYLYKYASNMKSGLNFNNSDMVSNALVSLKSHHKFLGISIIVILSLYILLIIGMVILFASKAGGHM